MRVEINLEELRPTVEMLAHQTFPKIKKPTHLGIDDLVQEGLMVSWEWVNRWYRPDSGASPVTFAINGVKFHFTDLVKKSWKSITTMVPCGEDDGEDSTFIDSLPGSARTEVINTIVSLSSFSEQEKEYTALILNPGTKIRKKLLDHPRQLRVLVRSLMGISIDVENSLREKIQHKLEELNKQN